MNEDLRKKIISEYRGGKASTVIDKEFNVSKPVILKILHEEGIIRKRDRCSSLDIKKDEDGFFYLFWTCRLCNQNIKRFSKNSSILCRNHYNHLKCDGVCKECRPKIQSGPNNPFYGKKHTKESLIKMTKTLTENPRKFSSSSKPEMIIFNILKELKYDVKKTYRINHYICDIFIIELNLIIEYNGDYWHCNPKRFDSNYLHPHKKKLAKEIWGDDNIRIDNLKNYGYNLEVIWESDFDEQNTIQNIIKKYDKN